MDLVQLAQREDQVAIKLRQVTGYIDDRIRQVSQLGVEVDYRDIFAGYVALLSDPVQAAEALKRSVFLAWFSYNEPTWLSGVGELPEETIREVMEALDAALINSVGDSELQAMLSYYIRVCELPFNLYPDLLNLKAFITSAQAKTAPNAWRASVTNRRGQMGEYWGSLRSDV